MLTVRHRNHSLIITIIIIMICVGVRLFEKQRAFEDVSEESAVLRQKVYELDLMMQRLDDELSEKKIKIYE